MNNPLNNFIQALRGERLSDASFARIRATLASYADLHAVPASALSHTPMQDFLTFFSMRQTRYVSAFVIVLVVAGGGTLGAAERALPGDALYGVKVHVTERASAFFANTPEEEGELANRLATRRTDEALALLAADALDDETARYLEAEVASNVEASDAAAVALEAKGDVSASLAVRSELAGALATRVATLPAPEESAAGAAMLMVAEEPPAETRMMKTMSFEAASVADIAAEEPALPPAPKDLLVEQLRTQAAIAVEAQTRTASALLPGIADVGTDLSMIATTSATATPALWMPQ